MTTRPAPIELAAHRASTRPVLLLTGASGVLGQALVDDLAADHDIIALRGTRPIDDPRVSELVADLTEPLLGLSALTYADLVARVDVVLHAAAVTKWNADLDLVRAVNVGGTAAILRLAEAAQAPLYYLSTAFVIHDAPADERFSGLATYLDTKVAAENLLRASSHATVIVRPSVVTGDSRDGRMAAFQGIHRMLGSIIRGSLPVLPADVDALVDTVPQDLVVDAIGHLIRTGVTYGEYWLTAGPHALTFDEFIVLAAEVSALAHISAPRPRFMPFESVDRLLLPLLDDFITPAQKQMFIDFLESVCVFQSTSTLPSDLDALGFGHRMTRAALTDATRQSLVYWAQVKGLLPFVDPREREAV